MQIFFPWEVSKPFTGAYTFIRRVEYDIEREKGTRPVWAPSRRLDRKKPSGCRPADAIAYTQTTCSTGAMPTPQSSAANTMDKPCSPTWQAFTPTQPHKPGNKN